MKILMVDIKESGIVDLQKTKHIILEGITKFNQVFDSLIQRGERSIDYRYCALEDNAFIPFYMKIHDGLFNQMQEFSFGRVTFKELAIPEEEKESLINQIITRNNSLKIKDIVSKGTEALLLSQVDPSATEEVKILAEELKVIKQEVVD